MLSSVIPARLEFQCGHAALVSLPRIKGESSAQRNARIVREKLSAQRRACDFCGPPVIVDGAPPLVALAAPFVPAAAPVVADASPAATVVAEAAHVPSPAADEELLPVRDVAVLDAEPPAVNPAPVESAAETKTSPRVVARRRAIRNGAAAEHTNGNHAPVAAPLSAYRVSFEVERVVHAADIHEALRQAESLGRGEVVAISSV